MESLRHAYEKELEFSSRVTSTASAAYKANTNTAQEGNIDSNTSNVYNGTVDSVDSDGNILMNTIKVKWTRKKGDVQDEDSLRAIFNTYGSIDRIFIG